IAMVEGRLAWLLAKHQGLGVD
nr:hypothetical protein [Tanacetum cinerariifolium]